MADGEAKLPDDDRLYRIDGWRFDAAAGELSRDGVRRRLEDRAARTLELLCRARGRVLTRQEIHDAIWGGRALSPNSLAVVIADLRQALEDDERQLIETVPKRGYRLADAPAAPVTIARPPSRRWAAGLALAVAVVGLGAFGLFALRPAPVLTVGVGPIVNQTGDPAFDPLARSTSELTLTYLNRARGIAVTRGSLAAGTRSARRLNLQGRLALWSGAPVVYLTATDPRTSQVVWSGMAMGPEDALPANIDKALAEFAAKAD